MPMEDLVDIGVHPPPREIRTASTEDERPPLHWTQRAALVLLAVFGLALPLAGFLGPVAGLSIGLGLLGVAVAALTASILLGAS